MREGTFSTKESFKIGSKTNTNSRYYYSEFVSDANNTSLFGVLEKGFIGDKEGDTYHYVTQEESGRLDKVALEEYGKASLWWLIAWANKIIDPFLLVPGTQLYIPNMNEYRKASLGG